MNTLAYTFRTFPQLEELQRAFPNIHIFGQLKRDISFFCDEIVEVKPDFIIGIAHRKRGSFFEPIAVNQFHRTGKINPNSVDRTSLFVPSLENTDFRKSTHPSDSFCNYSMFKIKHFLDEHKIKTPFSFTHLSKKGISELPCILKNQDYCSSL